MYPTIIQWIPKPWLCTIQQMEYINHGKSEIDKRLLHKKSSSHSIFVVTSGKGLMVYTDRESHLEKGMIMFVPAGTPIKIEGSPWTESNLQYYKLDLVVAEVKEDISDHSPTIITTEQQEFLKGIEAQEALPLIQLSYSPWSSCLEALEQMLRQQVTGDWLEQWEVQLHFQEWFRALLQQSAPETELPDDRARLQSSIRYIGDHYDQTITVDELAADIGLTRASYTRQFKKITGKLPLEYVNAVRLERSKQLLQLTDDRIHEIAQNVGFSSEYYFGRRFKQYAGISPGLYRRHHRQEVRVFAPYLEDFVLALGVKPVLQCSHHSWGRQHYLGLDDVPEFDVSQMDAQFNLSNVPDFIMLNKGYDRWNLDRFEQVAPTFYVDHLGEDWRSILRSTADVLGKVNRVQDVIGAYEDKAMEAKSRLARYMRGQTVAFLRISASDITLYGDQQGYVGPVIYQDLGLTPHSRVQQWTRHERRIPIGLDQLSQLNADHLLITFDTGNSAKPGDERELLDRDEWKRLSAVKSGNVYEVDFMSWMNYGVISHGKKIEDVLRFMA
ncbi:helix-turn-helix domain-containing protein [Paenibacillus xylanexedens]|uniref:helix-turn-helix domain-containing protein n=1 Tax=Paenibacillus xylanexedens TaxID=528191 RepID=UPI00142E18EE|nr:helix-turn-helix domain-containing protein [Paenibacillus xylanexedens]